MRTEQARPHPDGSCSYKQVVAVSDKHRQYGTNGSGKRYAARGIGLPSRKVRPFASFTKM
jgi:hypothetical protein